ncbi:MAG: discoidin domain-containing protein, partial [Deltaproteobacteria bacterium]|nr:discoidin domain-containing protein [Deltaproteobacteria bacterium]
MGIAQTAPERAAAFLQGSADPRGSWGSSRDETSLRDTAQVVMALRDLGLTETTAYSNGLAWLAEERRKNTDDLARAALALAGTPLDFAAVEDRAQLLSARVHRSGWGLGLKDKAISPMDTALATSAVIAQLSAQELDDVMTALSLEQRPDGGWGSHHAESLVAMTAEALQVIMKVEARFGGAWDFTLQIDDAVAFLVGKQGSDGRIGSGVLETALATRALLACKRPVAANVTAAINYLLGEQLADGSWEGDPFRTAAAVLAIRAAGPNLAVGASGVTFTPQFPIEGDSLSIRASVENTGAQAAGAFLVRVYRGAPEAGIQVGADQVIGGLGIGERADVAVQASTAGMQGGQTFTVVIDANGQVFEADETDNVRAYWVAIEKRKEPDLVLTLNDIRFNPPRGGDGDPIDISATVRNVGDDGVAATTVKFYDGKPTEGGVFLGTQEIGPIPAHGEATAQVNDLTFPQGVFDIYATVDEPGAVAEAREDNNIAHRPLVITEHVDLVVTNAEITLSPGNTVAEGTPILVFASVMNQGEVAAADVVLRLTNTGEEVNVGAIPAGGVANAVFSFQTLDQPGFVTLEVVADPRDMVSETKETNNIGRAFLEVTPLVDLYIANVPAASAPVMEGDPISVYVPVYNEGEQAATNVALGVFDGNPASGGRRLAPNALFPMIGGGFKHEPGFKATNLVFSSSTLSLGAHNLVFVVDPENQLREAREDNNAFVYPVQIAPRPDFGVAAADVTATPASPEEGDSLTITAVVRNRQPQTPYQNSSLKWRALLYDGDPGAGKVLAEKQLAGFNALEVVTLTATVPTDGRVGDNRFTVVVDPEKAVPDRDRTNNVYQTTVRVGDATVADPSITRDDLSVAPARFATGDVVTLKATIHNTRPAALASVPVAFFLGNPSVGGTRLGDVAIALPAKGEATASVDWDTTGLIAGDVAIYAVIDPDKTLAEGNEDNNSAGRGIEVGLGDASRPTGLSATPQGAGANLSWTAPATAAVGTYPLRGEELANLSTSASPRASASADADDGMNRASAAIDADPWSAWVVPNAGLPHWLEVDLGAKRYVKTVKLSLNAVPDFDIQTWDGVNYVTQVEVRGNDLAQAPTMVLPAVTKTRKVRIVFRSGNTSQGKIMVFDAAVGVLAPIAATSFGDTKVFAGHYSYAVTAVNAAGIESRPSEPAAVDITSVPAPATPSATASGNDVVLSWAADGSGRRKGVYIKRDGAFLDLGAGEADITTTGTWTVNAPMPVYPIGNAIDGNTATYYRAQAGTPAPYVATATFPAPRPVARVDLYWGSATGVTIETWDGTAFVPQVTIDSAPARLETYRFKPVTTDRVRVVAKGSAVSVLKLNEVRVHALAPLAATATTYTDRNVPAAPHEYAIVAIDDLGQDGAATVGTSITPLPPVTGVTASVSGRNVTVSWATLANPNVAGYRVLRNGVAVNGPDTATNLSLTATEAGSPGSTNPQYAKDNLSYTAWSGTPTATTEHWLQLAFAGPRRLRRVQIDWGGNAALTYRMETWDGSRWISQVERVSTSNPAGPQDYNFAGVVVTDRVRLVLPRQAYSGSYINVRELRVHGEAVVTGTSFTDASVPDGAHAYQVAAVDKGGTEGAASDPATATLGSATAPTGLAATVSANGDVTLTWSAGSGDIAGYHLYRNGSRVTTTAMSGTTTTHHVTLSGDYRFEVSAVSGTGNETARSNAVDVVYTDTTPPSPPAGFAFGDSLTKITWLASPKADDVVGYNVYRVDGPGYVLLRSKLQGQVQFVDASPVFGVTKFTWRVTAVDASGLESAPAEITQSPPAPTPPTNVSVSTYETSASVVFTGVSSPYALTVQLNRDGAPAAFRRIQATATASSALLPAAYATDDLGSYNEDSYWESEPLDPQPYIEFSGTYLGSALIPVDRVHVQWLSPEQAARSFVISAELFDGSRVDLLSVTGNQELEKTYDLSPYRVVRSLRLTVTEKASPTGTVGLFDFAPYYASSQGGSPLRDEAVPGGPHDYSVVTWDIFGQRSAGSTATRGNVSDVDLVVSPEDIGFSKDKVSVGEAVTVRASVHNTGTAAVSTPFGVELYWGDPAAGGTLLGTQSVPSLLAGGRADLTFPWTVAFDNKSLYVLVDRTNAIAEREEDNNKTARGAPYSFPYRSYVFSQADIIPFGWEDGTAIQIRSARTGQTVFAGTLARGAHPRIAVPETGVYHVSGSKKFSLYTGHVDVVGHYALDKEGSALSTEFYTVLGFWQGGYNHVVAFAVEDDTQVTITNTDTSQVLYSGTIQRGEHAMVSDLVLRYNAPVFVHVTASKPVTVLSTSDLGYSVADVRGKFSGTEFFTMVQTKPYNEDEGYYQLNLVSYQDDTFVRVRNQETGQEYFAGRLGKETVKTLPNTTFPAGKTTFLHVEASNTVSAMFRPYTGPGKHGGLAESTNGSGASGSGIATEFLEIAQPIGRSTGDFNVLFSYYDNTQITVREVARADNTPPNGVIASVNLDDGEFLDLGRKAGSLDTTATGTPGRLLAITSNHPISGRFGGGLEAADFMPVLFGSANNPDLEIRSNEITVSNPDALPGAHVTITAKLHNVGIRAAEGFPVDFYDGDPARGGKRLHREFVDELIAGDALALSIPYEIASGFHDIYVIADPEGATEELDEENNKGHLLLKTKPDLAPTIVAVLPEGAGSPLAGEKVTVKATLVNDGGAHVTRTDLQLFDGDPAAGGKELASESVSLMAGENRELTLEWDTRDAAAGAHSLYLLADGANLADEADEKNNVASADVALKVPDTNDLAVTAVTLATAQVYGGTPTSAKVTVANKGRLVAPITIRLSMDGVVVGEESLRVPLRTAEEHAFELAFTAPPVGNHELVAVVDPAGAIAEADEANNTMTVPFTTMASEVAIDLVDPRPTYGPGEDAEFVINLTNQAAARLGQVELFVRDQDGAVVATDRLLQGIYLPEMGEDQVIFTWNTETRPTGVYTVEARYLEEVTTRPVGEVTLVEGGVLRALDTGTITITPRTPIRVTVAADKAAYAPNGEAIISTYIEADAAGNAPMEGAEVVTEVIGPDGTAVFRESRTIDLHPGAVANLFATWNIANALPGTYRARATAQGVAAEDEFSVSTAALGTVSATMEVAPIPVAPGVPLAVTSRAINLGPTDLVGALVEARLIDATTGAVSATQAATADLVRSTPVDFSFSFNIDTLAPDHRHVAVVEITHGGVSLALVHKTWEIGDSTPPVISIAGVTSEQCSPSPITPVIGVTDEGPATVEATLNGAPYASGTPVTVDGTYLLAVTATDRSGNRATASVGFTVDTLAPAIDVTGVTDGMVAREVTPAIGVVEANATSQSILLDGAAFVSGTTVAAEGDHELAVAVSDCAGHATTRTVRFAIDRTVPVIEVSGVTSGALQSTDVTPIIAVRDAHPASQAVTLNGMPFVSGTTVSAEGDYTLRASATDAAGNAATEVVVSFTIDRTPPEITVAGVADGQLAAGAVTPSYTVTDAHLTTSSATLDGAPLVSGTAVSADGDHRLVVSGVDGAGNSRTVTINFTIDATPPALEIGGVEDGRHYAAAVTPTAAFGDADLVETTLTLNGAAFVSGTVVSSEGAYRLEATARDRAGNRSGRIVTFVIDTAAPIITVTGVTADECTAGSLAPTVAAEDPYLASVTATLDGVPFESGTPVTADGKHELVVQAVDKAGNVATVTRAFTIDNHSPVIAVEGVTDDQFVAAAVAPTVVVTDANLVSQAATLDGAPFVSGTVVSAEGRHVLEVSATDCAGATTRRTVTFTIDSSAPVVAVNGARDGDYLSGPATIQVTTSDATEVTLTVTLDGAPFASGTTVSTDGEHALVAIAVDQAGNRTERRITFTIDQAAPVVSIAGVTDGACGASAITPTFTVEDANLASVAATMGGVAFASGTAVTADGRHELVVTATDKAGHTTTATRTFTIDAAAPVVEITGVTDGQFAAAAVTPVITITDANLVESTVTLDGAAYASGTAITTEGAHRLEA